MSEREQRLVFGEVADEYERARPTYPDALYDALVALSGIGPGDPVLDVGAGTGKATEGLVARGFAVTAVEPSPDMARVLRSRLPQVAVQISSFEDCDLDLHLFAMITAAQSWHWVDPERGPMRAHALLRPGGWLALFWNSAALDDCAWHDDLQPIYRRLAPNLAHENLAPVLSAGVRHHIDQLTASGVFDAPVVRHLPWTVRYTTDEYVALLETHSNHRMLPDDERVALHTAIAASIDARGGVIEHPYTTDLVAARVK